MRRRGGRWGWRRRGSGAATWPTLRRSTLRSLRSGCSTAPRTARWRWRGRAAARRRRGCGCGGAPHWRARRCTRPIST
eukprot:scaffold138771_cov148-Phaeocystis_antarctica.AAC.1